MHLRSIALRALVVTAVAALAFAVLPVAQAKPDTTRAGPRIAIGDSVMLGAKWNLLNRQNFTLVDAVVSRQSGAGPGLLRQLGEELPNNVVVHLGTNGSYPIKTCKQLVKAAGPTRKVFLMTIKVPRLWEAVNNKMLRACDAEFPADQVQIIDWNWAASRHGEWLYDDGVHLRPEGARAFARVITAGIARAYPAEVTAAVPADVMALRTPGLPRA